MCSVIPINIVVEDVLSELVVRKILINSGQNYDIGACYCHSGYGYIKRKISGFNNAAKGTPFFVLTDLDSEKCAPLKIRQWLNAPKNHNLIFRIAVRQVESWLLADRKSFSKFLAIAPKLLPSNPDNLENAKTTLLNLAQKSRKRNLKEALIPAPKSTAKIGPDYNGALNVFVSKYWNIEKACLSSPSLKSAFDAVKVFRPMFGSRQ